MTKQTKINQSDLKIYPSERLTDNDDGGGMPTTPALTGEANELFDPISNIARLNGGFYARSVFSGVLRPDDEPLIGAFTAITQPPKDESVSYLLFGAGRFGESRAEVLKRLEAYSIGTIESRMTLLSTQSQNSRIIQAYQRVGEPLPNVGDRYQLLQNKRGYSYLSQYVQVVKVQSEDRKFSRDGREFTCTVIQMEISGKLQHDFIGMEYPVDGYASAPCKVLETYVADAAQYYGIKPLAQAIQSNNMQIHVPSLMEKIIPTNQVETRLTDLSASGDRQTLFDGTKNGQSVNLSINKYHRASDISSLYFGNAITPNSVNISTSSGNITDKGGTLQHKGNTVGSIDYARGTALINEPNFTASINSLNFRPAGSELKLADTLAIPVDVNNRSYNYVITLTPIPAVGTLRVSYRSQGRWYDLNDDGSGSLRGASQAHGSGSINFATGTVQFGTGELADVDSSILLSWGTRANYFNRSDSQPKVQMRLLLSHPAIASSIILTWQGKGGKKTARCDATGNITGDCTGKYDHKQEILIDDLTITGQVTIEYAALNSEPIWQTVELSVADGIATGTLPNTTRLKGSIRIEWTAKDGIGQAVGGMYVTDDGAGNLINANGESKGTIDYGTGALRLDTNSTAPISKPTYQEMLIRSLDSTRADFIFHKLSGYESVNETVRAMPRPGRADDEFRISFYAASNGHTDAVGSGELLIDLLPVKRRETVVLGSVNFELGGKIYHDKAGQLVTDLNTLTGESTKAGAVDYTNAKVTINAGKWSPSSLKLNSLVTTITDNPVDSVAFRIPVSPIRPRSLQIRATALDGTQLTALADSKGKLSAEYIQGTVDVEYGVATVRFGKTVKISDGEEWQPKHVFAESVTYNAVAYSYLPVNSKVVKIDTVRLPQDGRVPIFRRGDTILITNTKEQDIGSAHTGGQTVQLERDDVDRICVSDAGGRPVNAELWTYDLDAGSITWVQSLDLSEYQMPLTVKHTQEERNVILEADIDGTLSLRFATKRAYPIENTYVSSVLIGDTLRVRASVPFTQRNWDNVWRDEPNGGQLLNRLKVKDYPIRLTDDGAITEKWLIKFVSSSQFELYGQALGFVKRTDTLTDLAPINPATNKPYFTIDKRAFGADAPWASQDVIRFNTWGTLMPVWVLCAVQPTSNPLQEKDGFSMCLFGDTTEV